MMDSLSDEGQGKKFACAVRFMYLEDGGAAEMIHQVRVQRANHNRASTSAMCSRARHLDDCDIWQHTV